ncbi:MAG: hypothetical protein SFH39_03135 [Candidatus Magnetobacterium sp. LHC-1]|uniref:Uncharacterized protein n=1 Tax=Candidatus Magnetobacterium casense TaxID=1455061 RepID=A0ABS6RZZ5_9BACT|nr:hypothetical protein [Candidatus Magnetobacterium casensis]MBF0608650.1 hypothetical protein [Nitrospirota bacterium]MBV6341947.1 hypothetical protein [Candidatus Magnetobacterium casensis]
MDKRKVNKHLKLDPILLERAKKILDTKTDSETVEKALGYIIDEGQIREAIKSMKGIGGIEAVYD